LQLSKDFDLGMLAIHLGLVTPFSILLLKEDMSNGRSRSTVLLRIRRWWTDDRAV